MSLKVDYLSDSLVPILPQKAYKVYATRWIILVLFVLLSSANAIVWITFAPITTASKIFFNQDAQEINMLSTVFIIVFLPSNLLVTYLNKYISNRVVFYICASLQALGSVIRASIWFYRDYYPYERVLLGQIITGIAQPGFITMSSQLAAVWFPSSERVLATTVASMANAIGIAIGQLVSQLSISVSEDPTTGISKVTGVYELLVWQAILLVAIAVATLIIWKEKPPTPPSSSAEARIMKSNDEDISESDTNTPSSINVERSRYEQYGKTQDNSIYDPYFIDSQAFSSSSTSHPSTLGGSSFSSLHSGVNTQQFGSTLTSSPNDSTKKSLFSDYCTLLTNINFVFLLFAYSIGISIFNVIATLVSQIVGPCGYESDAGTFGSLLIIFGTIGCGIFIPILNKTKAYRPLLRLTFIFAFILLVITLGMIQPGQLMVLSSIFAVFGLIMMPILPVMLETAAECTYPMSEQTGVSLLMACSQAPCILLVFFSGEILNQINYEAACNAAIDREKNTAFFGVLGTHFSYLILSVCLLAVIMTLFYNGKYLRLEHEENTKRGEDAKNEQVAVDSIYAQTNVNALIQL